MSSEIQPGSWDNFSLTGQFLLPTVVWFPFASTKEQKLKISSHQEKKGQMLFLYSEFFILGFTWHSLEGVGKSHLVHLRYYCYYLLSWQTDPIFFSLVSENLRQRCAISLYSNHDLDSLWLPPWFSHDCSWLYLILKLFLYIYFLYSIYFFSYFSTVSGCFEVLASQFYLWYSWWS